MPVSTPKYKNLFCQTLKKQVLIRGFLLYHDVVIMTHQTPSLEKYCKLFSATLSAFFKGDRGKLRLDTKIPLTSPQLMNICLNGPSLEEFVAEKAIIHWVRESQRVCRPNFLFSVTLSAFLKETEES